MTLSDDGQIEDVAPSDLKRQKIVRVSAELFAREGYHNVSMIDIANAVGLRKPSLYHYFKGKTEILVSIHEDFFTPALKFAESVRDLPPREALTELIRDMLKPNRTHPGHMRVVFEHDRELPEPEATAVQARRRAYYEIVESILKRGIETGEFREVDARLTSFGIFGMIQWSYQWYRPGGYSLEYIGEAFSDLVLEGLTTS